MLTLKSTARICSGTSLASSGLLDGERVTLMAQGTWPKVGGGKAVSRSRPALFDDEEEAAEGSGEEGALLISPSEISRAAPSAACRLAPKAAWAQIF